MRIEHWGYQVADPVAVTRWYCEHMGFSVKRVNDDEARAHFLADESGRVMIEVYRNPTIVVPDYPAMSPFAAHLAFVCEDVPATIERLQQAGASLVSVPMTTPVGDILAMMRDPWGMPVQLCHRARSMV